MNLDSEIVVPLDETFDRIPIGTELVGQIEGYTFLPSPISRLPPELVAIIIDAALHGPKSAFDATRRRRFAELRSVCSGWRWLMFSMPHLWCSLEIDLDDWDDHGDPESTTLDMIEKATSWFARAGKGKLFELILTSTREYGLKKLDFPMLVTFLVHSHYTWGTLKFESRVLEWLENVAITSLTTQGTPWDTVQNLTLDLDILKLRELGTIFTAFPRLESLSLNAPLYLSYEDSTSFHHSNLRSLRLSGIAGSLQGFANFTLAFSALRELFVVHWGDWIDLDILMPTIHPSLEQFIVMGQSLTTTSVLLSAFTFPSLRLLRFLNVRCDIYTNQPQGLNELIARCNPDDLTVSLEYSKMHDAAITNLVAPLPVVHRLHVRDLSFLAGNDLDLQPTFPDSLGEIVCMDFSALLFLPLAQAIRSRFAARHRVVKVYIPYGEVTKKYEFEEGVRLMREVGFELDRVPISILDRMLDRCATRSHDLRSHPVRQIRSDRSGFE